MGAAAGLTAIVGLAVLSALYISHARDVKRLREWAGRVPERSGPDVTAVPGRAAGVQARGAAGPSGAPVSRSSYVAVALAGVLVLGGVAAYGVTQLTSGGGDNGSPNKPRRSGAAVTPGNVTVAVLNGTTVSGLAAMLRDQIAAAGFMKGAINDFSDKQLAESVVEYAPGHRAAAEAVGHRLGISRCQPVTTRSRALAGDATVIVVAGADKAP
jgi:hypothetical protein